MFERSIKVEIFYHFGSVGIKSSLLLKSCLQEHQFVDSLKIHPDWISFIPGEPLNERLKTVNAPGLGLRALENFNP